MTKLRSINDRKARATHAIDNVSKAWATWTFFRWSGRCAVALFFLPHTTPKIVATCSVHMVVACFHFPTVCVLVFQNNKIYFWLLWKPTLPKTVNMLNKRANTLYTLSNKLLSEMLVTAQMEGMGRVQTRHQSRMKNIWKKYGAISNAKPLLHPHCPKR